MPARGAHPAIGLRRTHGSTMNGMSPCNQEVFTVCAVLAMNQWFIDGNYD